MTKQTRKLQDKNVVRDCLTNRRIGNKEVVIVDNAIDYVKKQGYIYIYRLHKKNKKKENYYVTN
jgi:hypothetical protein